MLNGLLKEVTDTEMFCDINNDFLKVLKLILRAL